MLEIGSYVDGKYKVLNKVGQGGMSVVYLVMNEKANKQWAIKEVRKDGIRDFEVVKQGLIVETDMLKKLSHPNLPSIIDVIDDEETFLIVMDYIQGNPLNKSLEEFGAQPQENVISWAKQLCDVLGYLHSQEPPIIYRDMKPSNVMLKPDGRVTLIDFGTAREFKEKNIADTTCLGTLGYAAPEQFGGMGQTDARTDIYCLGATLYHLVTGISPCEPPYEIRPIRDINPTLSGGLEQIILKCTQRNPEDRYQNCAELMYALEHYDEIDDIFKKKQKKKLAAFGATVVGAAAFLGAAIFFGSKANQLMTEHYDSILVKATSSEHNQERKQELLLEAMELNPEREEAYLRLVELFLSGDDSTFSQSESAVLTQVKAGLDIENDRGMNETIYPLAELKKQNKKGYRKVCYEIGLAYWYDYAMESERYQLASEWFAEAVEDYPVAKVFVDIGECQKNIERYDRQKRTTDLHGAYHTLWEKLCELKDAVEKSEDIDTKIIVWDEIVRMISEEAAYFLVNVSAQEILTFLDEIYSVADKIKGETKYDVVRESIDEIFVGIEMARSRVQSVQN